jgi:hypothetical protein
LNKREFYTLKSWHTWLGTRISPKNVRDEAYAAIWGRMSHFEKLCRSWNYISGYAVKSARQTRRPGSTASRISFPGKLPTEIYSSWSNR